MAGLRVISPGFLTIVQDLGRFGYAHLGISASGAADAVSLRLGNLLVGNSENIAALEMTLTGAEIEFPVASVIALAGADMEPTVDGETLPLWATIRIKPGQILKCGAARSGARTYLCIRGGVDVLQVFGSASTHTMTGMGGFSGRELMKGDIVPVKETGSPGSFKPVRIDPHFLSFLLRRNTLRVTPGPQEHLFDTEARQLFYSSSYEVREESDRVGLRLRGPALIQERKDLEILTEGVSLGSVQVTHDGTPIILFVDHQTTGGYPKIANVISADMHTVGQIRPRDRVRFSSVSVGEAHRLLEEQETLLHHSPLLTV